MRNSIRAYKRNIQEIEKKAASVVDLVSGIPILDRKKLDAINEVLIKKIKGDISDAINEGRRWGKFIKQKSEKRN